MKRSIDLEPTYQCQHCLTIVEKSKIEITRTDEVIIKHCPHCGYGEFKKII